MSKEKRLTVDRLNDKGCINILSELLKRMTREFNEAFRNHLADPDNNDAYVQYEQIKDEFLSDYFFDLTRLNGAYVVRKLEESVRNSVSQAA